MLELFIAELSLYANCVPRSHSFCCRMKMSLLFNVRMFSLAGRAFTDRGAPPQCQSRVGASLTGGYLGLQAWEQPGSGCEDCSSCSCCRVSSWSCSQGLCQALDFCLLCLWALLPSADFVKPDGSLCSAAAGVLVVPSTWQVPARLPSASLPGSAEPLWLWAVARPVPVCWGMLFLGSLSLAQVLIHDSVWKAAGIKTAAAG